MLPVEYEMYLPTAVEGVVQTVGQIRKGICALSAVRAITTAIRALTADVPACRSTVRRRAIRVAKVSVKNEPGTIETVVVAGSHGNGR